MSASACCAHRTASGRTQTACSVRLLLGACPAGGLVLLGRCLQPGSASMVHAHPLESCSQANSQHPSPLAHTARELTEVRSRQRTCMARLHHFCAHMPAAPRYCTARCLGQRPPHERSPSLVVARCLLNSLDYSVLCTCSAERGVRGVCLRQKHHGNKIAFGLAEGGEWAGRGQAGPKQPPTCCNKGGACAAGTRLLLGISFEGKVTGRCSTCLAYGTQADGGTQTKPK